jgi:hypothetical protein
MAAPVSPTSGAVAVLRNSAFASTALAVAELALASRSLSLSAAMS